MDTKPLSDAVTILEVDSFSMANNTNLLIFCLSKEISIDDSTLGLELNGLVTDQ